METGKLLPSTYQTPPFFPMMWCHSPLNHGFWRGVFYIRWVQSSTSRQEKDLQSLEEDRSLCKVMFFNQKTEVFYQHCYHICYHIINIYIIHINIYSYNIYICVFANTTQWCFSYSNQVVSVNPHPQLWPGFFFRRRMSDMHGDDLANSKIFGASVSCTPCDGRKHQESGTGCQILPNASSGCCFLTNTILQKL